MYQAITITHHTLATFNPRPGSDSANELDFLILLSSQLFARDSRNNCGALWSHQTSIQTSIVVSLDMTIDTLSLADLHL